MDRNISSSASGLYTLFFIGYKIKLSIWLARPFQKMQRTAIKYVCLSVRVEQRGSHWRDFHEIWYLRIFWKSVEKIQLSLNPTRMTGALQENLRKLMVIYSRIIFRLVNLPDKSCRKQTHISCLTTFLYLYVYGIMWKKIWYGQTGHRWQQYNKAHKKCDLHAEWMSQGYGLTLIIFGAIFHWLRERAVMLCYAFIVTFFFCFLRYLEIS
jgi:hypothetical protein